MSNLSTTRACVEACFEDELQNAVLEASERLWCSQSSFEHWYMLSPWNKSLDSNPIQVHGNLKNSGLSSVFSTYHGSLNSGFEFLLQHFSSFVKRPFAKQKNSGSWSKSQWVWYTFRPFLECLIAMVWYTFGAF
jgi:hypothetical protein